MIGTSIRSIRHLYRVSDASLKTILVKFKENAWEICKVMKTPNDSPFNGALFVFNNVYKQSNWPYDTVVTSDYFRKKNDISAVANYGRILTIYPTEFSTLGVVFNEITLLPDSFDSDYEKFLKENSKMIGSLTSSIGINTKDVKIKRLYIYSDGSKNFFQWAVNTYFKNGVSLSTIKSILQWNDSYKQLAKNLSKGTITAYTSRDSIIPLLDELSELRKEKRINDSINSFNTAQKKILKENKLSEDIRQALWRLSRLSDTKRLNFIKKMSSVDDFNELCRQLKFVTSVHFSWNKESLIDFLNNVENIKYEKIYENDNVVLIKAFDYETIKQLGKTTNWCISKNKHYWNNYIENYHGQTTQYIVFDFSKVEDDKLSIVGFTTTRNKGITAAHNFINEDLMGNAQNDQTLLESFISGFKDNKNIYSILGDLGIDITLIIEYDMPQYEWNKESAMKYLYECVNKENVDILKSEGDKIVLSVTDQNLRYFFGDTYHDNIPSDYYSLQHIIFMDFSKNKYDVNKIQFGIIEEGYGDEDYCNGVYNEHSLNSGKNFDSLLIEFGLPYNTIRRTNNPLVKLRNGIVSFNTPMIKECMKECSSKDLLRVMKNEIGDGSMYDLIMKSVESFMSFDYLKLFYDNNLKLNDIMPKDYISDLIKHFASNLRALSRSTDNFTNLNGISDEEIDDFYNFRIRRREDTKYVGYYLVIKQIIENEKFNGEDANNVYGKFLNYMDGCGKHIEIFEQIVDLFKDSLDYNSSHVNNSIIYLAKYTVFYGSPALKEFITKKSESNKVLKTNLERYTNEYEKRFKNKKENGLSGIYRITVNNNNDNLVTVARNAIDEFIDDLDGPF